MDPDRTKEFRSCLQLAYRRAGKAAPPLEDDPHRFVQRRPRETETLRASREILLRLRDIDAFLGELEALAGVKATETRAGHGFERVMETVEADCKAVDVATRRLVDASDNRAKSPQRRHFERQIALHLQAQLADRTKKVQQCAVLRQKTLKEQQRRTSKFAHAGPGAAARVRLDSPMFEVDAFRRRQTSSSSSRKQDENGAGERKNAALPPGARVGSTFASSATSSNAAASGGGPGGSLRNRRHTAGTTAFFDPSTVDGASVAPAAGVARNSRLQLQERQQQQQQQLLLEQTARRRLDRAQTIESEISKLGDLFSRFSSLLAQQGEVVERLDDDVEHARLEVEAGHAELTKAQKVLQGNRALIIKIFAILITFIILFVAF